MEKERQVSDASAAFEAQKERLDPTIKEINALNNADLVLVLDFVMYKLGSRSRCPGDQSRGCPCVLEVIVSEMMGPYREGAKAATHEKAPPPIFVQAKRGEA